MNAKLKIDPMFRPWPVEPGDETFANGFDCSLSSRLAAEASLP
jgi:hypothetical protein